MSKSKTERSCEFVNVTKEMADKWLEETNILNRRMRPFRIEKYSRDRIHGLWITTHEAISWDWNGVLLDGQHRLEMISKTGLATELLVVRGIDPKARMVTNIGATRTPADILRLLGWDTADSLSVAVVRIMMNGLGKSPTIPEIVEAYEIHQHAAHVSIGMFPTTKKKNITISPVIGAIGRAWYTQDEAKLQRFATILVDGMASRSKRGESSVILLRDFLLQLPNSRGGGSASREIYKMVTPALFAFLNGENLSKLNPADEELFPLPESLETKAGKRAAKRASLKEYAKQAQA